jgi:dUTP pyrophosphatase
MKVKIKRLVENAVLPSYSKPGDAGLDLTATSMKVVDNSDHGYIEYGTGLSFEIPEGYVGLLFPRSSISNTGLILANSVGVLDSSYRGEVTFRFKWRADTRKYNVGERVGQLIIMPYPTIEFEEVSELSQTERGEGGYGSTN